MTRTIAVNLGQINRDGLPPPMEIVLWRPEESHSRRAALAMISDERGSEVRIDENYMHWLGGSERETCLEMRHERRKRSFLLGRICAKQAVAHLTGEADPGRIRIGSGVFGQPIVEYPDHRTLGVSITHTRGGAAALAYPEDHPMGIDLEYVEPQRADTIRRMASMEERELVEALLADERLSEATLLTILWTAWEALSKILRCGMMAPFSLFSLDTLACHGAVLVGHYQQFLQYKSLSWILGESVLTVALPRRTNTVFNPLSGII